MFNIGDKVKLNIEELEKVDWFSLLLGTNKSDKDYKTYIFNNIDKIYTIINIDNKFKFYPYMLDDEFIKETSFAPEELIKQ